MENILVLTQIFIVCAALWVYWDATSKKIGKIPLKKKTLTNASAGVWASITGVVFIIVFPLYLFNRKKLIERAKKYPVDAGSIGFRVFKSVLLIMFLYASFSIPYMANLYGAKLPSCTSDKVTDLLYSNVIKSKDPNIRINTFSSTELNTQEDKLFCNMIINTKLGTQKGSFELSWQNKSKGQFKIHNIKIEKLSACNDNLIKNFISNTIDKGKKIPEARQKMQQIIEMLNKNNIVKDKIKEAISTIVEYSYRLENSCSIPKKLEKDFMFFTGIAGNYEVRKNCPTDLPEEVAEKALKEMIASFKTREEAEKAIYNEIMSGVFENDIVFTNKLNKLWSTAEGRNDVMISVIRSTYRMENNCSNPFLPFFKLLRGVNLN